MTCKIIRRWLLKHPERLTIHQREKIANHTKTCKTCGRFIHQLSNLDDFFRASKIKNIPENVTRDFWLKIENKIREDTASRIKLKEGLFNLRPVFVWGFSSLAAMILIFILSRNRNKEIDDAMNINRALLNVTIESVQIGNQDADISIFETNDPHITFIWMEEANPHHNGG